ncbi:hypothetical protein [Rhodomicrobium vannielii]|uniref:hypothetical protein n=1 Tax=Rhodomicrobium vannielii TaxID=1069 RepID=UPI0012DC7C78|nr:hypothetical protein [Rhodomicrobium vannielii]
MLRNSVSLGAGLLHDLGKYHPDFQRRLEGSDIRVEHSIAGAALLLSHRKSARKGGRRTDRPRRARLDFAGPMDNAALVDALGSEQRALVIGNSRAHALDLYRGRARRRFAPHHTALCGASARILKDVRARLENDRPCRLIATSLVEAGVDVDFPRVFRAEAGLDQIAQAAGRCNREGRRDPDASAVTVFEAVGYSVPSEIKGLIGDFGRIRHKHADLFAPAAIQDYFEEVFWRVGDRLDGKKILIEFKFDRNRTYFQYRTRREVSHDRRRPPASDRAGRRGSPKGGRRSQQ